VASKKKSHVSLATMVVLLDLAELDAELQTWAPPQMGPTCKRFVAEEQRWDFLEVLDVIQELERANGSWAETTPWQTD
jgi:hypothetical protein